MKRKLKYRTIEKSILLLNAVMALVYFWWWLHPGNAENKPLYYLLLSGEVYHLFMAFSFWLTMVKPNRSAHTLRPKLKTEPKVDIFITVAGEPVEIVRETARAARDMDYHNHRVYLLNDGYVAKKDNWQAIEDLAEELGIDYITRKVPGGAKAGNINNGLRQTRGEMVVIFDADMVPHKDFLKKTVGYFQDEKVGFVQTPQYYKNHRENRVTEGSWQQQEIFFGAIMSGKEKSNSSFICGTNVVIRRTALEGVGGMVEDNIAEDFLTSLRIHAQGWKSVYVNEILTEGLAPEDMLSYYKQQLRWARGSLEMVFKNNPLFKKGLSLAQKIEYLSSSLYYFNGTVIAIDMVMPLLFLFFSLRPVASSSTSFAIFFIPFMILNLYTLGRATRGKASFKSMAFSHSSFPIQLRALISIITGQKMGFSVTSKRGLEGNYLGLAMPHLLYIGLTLIGITIGTAREGLNPSVVTNIAWALVNCILFIPFIEAAHNPKKIVADSLRFSVAT